MNAPLLIPPPDAIPVHAGWFQFLLIAAFTVHILLMNITVGSCLIAFLNGWRRDGDGPEKAARYQDLTAKIPVVLALTINFGVAVLMFMQTLYGEFFYVSSQLMAVWWLSLIGLLIAGYYSAYFCRFSAHEKRNLLMGFALLLLMGVAFLFVSNITLMLSPEAWSVYFTNPQGTVLNLSDPARGFRYLHFMTASVAVAGLFLAVVWKLKRGKGDGDTRIHIDYGMKWFTYATLAQIIVGFGFQMSLPPPVLSLFMGESGLHTGLLLLGVILTLQAVYFGLNRRVWPAAGSLIVLVVAMILIRSLVRDAYLAPYFSPSSLSVTGRYSPAIMFLISLAAVAGIIVYVIRLAMTAQKKENETLI